MLQLTEDQFTVWSAKKQVMLVEVSSVQKIDVNEIALDKMTDRSD